MRIASIFIALLFCIPATVFGSEQNAGFVQGIWYSSEPVFAGIPTRIYVAIRNNTGHDLTGTVRFSDNGKRVGSFEVSALEGRLVEAWVDWTPTYGEHVITAVVSEAEVHVLGGDTETLDITGITASNTLSVDYDTDKDGVGNATDTDDDEDGVSDEDEKGRGSNPLVTNPKVTESETAAPAQEDAEEGEDARAKGAGVEDEKGLEQYFDNGTVDTLLRNITKKIGVAQEHVDTYRESRNQSDEYSPTETADEDLSVPTPLNTHNQNATITRTQLDKNNGFLSSFVVGVSTLLNSLWTLALFATSRVLSYPAILEALLLVILLFLLYRTARRFGRRQRY